MEVYAILFFEAKTDTVIRKGNDSKRISAGQTEQITNEKWADNIEDAKAEALAELPELLCGGVGTWLIGVFEADPEGNDTELLWEAVCINETEHTQKKGAIKMSDNTHNGQYDVITVNFGIGAERETLPAVKRVTTYTPRSGQTASGYGSKLPTRHMLHVGNRWRRVYAICWSNVSTCYIIKNGERIVISW